MPSFEQQVADLRDYLLKFARLQLRNEAWAEDAVSETVLAAIATPSARMAVTANPGARRKPRTANRASRNQFAV